MSKEKVIENMSQPRVTLKDISDYYESIYSAKTTEKITSQKEINKYLDYLFNLFNSNSNPLYAKDHQQNIQDLRLHTSMSIGDVIQFDDIYYVIDKKGFTQIN